MHRVDGAKNCSIKNKFSKLKEEAIIIRLPATKAFIIP
jgi:hypothetical protein